MQMRMHIEIDDSIVAEIDAVAGPRGRSAFVRDAVLTAVKRQRRTLQLLEAVGALRGSEHDWGDDAAGWVERQRRGDPRRVG